MTDYEKLGVFYLGRTYDAKSRAATAEPLLYDARDLTTHGVIVGMTGSGKTGLAVDLLEEAAIDGVPAIAIDPKGDLGNLVLAFPELRPEDFRPWVDPAEAERAGMDAAAYAAKLAETWRRGLAEWGQEPARIARFRDAVDVAVYTPGSTAGIPMSILASLGAPPPALAADPEALRERIVGTTSGLLGLLGIDADPVRSREHILVAKLLEKAWGEGRGLDLGELVRRIQAPPFERVGVLDLESFYPGKERASLAMALNNLLASPGFAGWAEGEPLDVARMLWTPEGKPRLSIVSIAHLSDAERMFFVTLLLEEVLAWVRTQSGTSSLRAILYMDEVFGYVPPVANPPSKTPMLTLLKQARAFGVGVVLATQNPVDLDYKGLSNAGTWFLGRLQTERDKERVLEGLEGASAASGKAFDRARCDAILSALDKRVFLMSDVHEDAPVLFQTRWALSYLRGPLTRSQIQQLTASRRAPAAAPAPRPAPVASAPARAGAERPVLPPDVAELFLPAPPGATYAPALLATARVHYVDAKAGVDAWENLAALAPLTDTTGSPWESASILEGGKPAAASEPTPGVGFSTLPSSATKARSYAAWQKGLADWLYRTRRMNAMRCPAVKLQSRANESEAEFRARVQLALRERRDAEIAKLRERYAVKASQLQEQERRAEERVARESAQYEQQKVQTAISMGASVLGALFGRKALSVGNLGRATTAARGVGRAAREREDIQTAQQALEAVRAKRSALEAEIQAAVDALSGRWAPDAAPVEAASLTPRKSDVAVDPPVLVWVPADGARA